MVDFFAAAQRVISMIMTGSELVIITWLVSGGVIYILRGISFWLDTLIVNFIGSIYQYFMTLLKGTMFNETVTDALLRNVYVFVGVFVFFRLAMVLIKYLMNPELISDEKSGVNSLIKRVIIGLAGILLVPLIFSKATELQSAIIEDQLIQQIIIPEDMINATSKTIDNAGKYIGTYVFAGFLSPSSKASNDKKKDYTMALDKGDFSSLDFNSGGFLGIGYPSYDYSYFYLLSTFVLAYVLYLMLKYCLDIVVRFFKLLLYQLMAPIAMVEYMINGSQDGVFKNWKNAVLGTYFMLFVRVLSIWFVVLVMTLMSGEYAAYTGESLLETNDYLLRALIIIGVLAFMMDLPKYIGNIFGLDLEQESSATGLLKSIGGIVKGVGMGALSAGGAALGGAAGALGGMQKAGLKNIAQRRGAIKEKMSQGMNRKDAMASLGMGKAGHSAIKDAMQTKMNANPNMTKKQAKAAVLAENKNLNTGKELSKSALSSSGETLKSAGKGVLKTAGASIVGSTAIGNAIKGGYSGVSSSMSSDRQKSAQKAQEEYANQLQAATASNLSEISSKLNLQADVELAARLKASGVPNLPDAVVNAKIASMPQIPQMTANVQASFDVISGSSGGSVTNVAMAQEVVTQELRGAGVSEQTIVETRNEIQKIYDGGGTVSSHDADKLVKGAYEREYRPQAEQASKLV